MAERTKKCRSVAKIINQYIFIYNKTTMYMPSLYKRKQYDMKISKKDIIHIKKICVFEYIYKNVLLHVVCFSLGFHCAPIHVCTFL